jgi:hypothetical protein
VPLQDANDLLLAESNLLHHSLLVLEILTDFRTSFRGPGQCGHAFRFETFAQGKSGITKFSCDGTISSQPRRSY